jgi:hypothetical protein
MAAKKNGSIENPLETGNCVFIQTVTFAFLGKVAKVEKDHLLLTQASWVSDTHRLHRFLAEGAVKTSEGAPEVEVFPPDMVSRIELATIVHSVKWPHPLPTETI